MIKSVIIDDDSLSINVLSKLLENFDNIDLYGSYSDPKEAMGFLENNTVDLIFLDIEMPGLNGFELLDSLQKSIPKVIIISAHNNYANEAFKYNVDDYLLKPFNLEELDASLKKVLGVIDDSFKASDESHLFIKDGSVIHRINKDDVSLIECIGDYAKVIDRSSKTYIVHSTMKCLCDKFHEDNFVRVHRSFIINMKDVKEIQGNTISIMDRIIPVGKTYKKSFFNHIDTI